MRRHIVHQWWCFAAALLAACSGSSAHPPTLPAVHTSPPSAIVPGGSVGAPSTTVIGATTSSSPGATSPVSTSTTAPAEGGVHLSAGGPWTRVASAPGITTPGLVYQLMPKLWVYLPTEEDVSKGVIWTLRAPDVPIIEAYLQARLVYFEAITSDPIDVSAPGWDKWYADGGKALKSALQQAISGGWTADLDVGVVLRPEVIGDGRDATNAIVFDCVLDGGVFRLPTGELAPGSTAGVTKQGFGARIIRRKGRWSVTQVGEQVAACV
jgi:hypothetical protein